MTDRMSHRERVTAAIAGANVDRPPYAFWRHFYDTETSAEGLAGSMVRFARRHNLDMLKVNPRAQYHVEPWGATFHYSGKPQVKPMRLEYPIKKADDWRRIEHKSPSEGELGEQLDAIRRIRRDLGPDLPIVETVFTPLSIAGDLIGADRELVVDMRENADAVHQALRAITDTFKAFASACRDAGADGIFLATTQWASTDLMTDELYNEFGRPYDLEVLNATRGDGAINVLHVCASHNMLAQLADYPVQILNWATTDSTNLSLAQAASKHWRPALMGGIGLDPLGRGQTDDVVRQVREATAVTGGRHWILGPACSVPTTTPEDTLDAAIAAVL